MATLLHHTERGTGPAVLLLSGGPGLAAGYMDDLAQRLSATHRTILPDQRGTGGSPATGPDALTLEAYLIDIEELRAALGVKKWAVVGHSWGSMLALAYAARHPQRVIGLVAMNNAALSAAVFDTLLPVLFQRLDPARQAHLQELLGAMPTAADPDAALADVFRALQYAYFADAAHAERFIAWITDATMSVPTYNMLSAHLKAIGFDLSGQLDTVRMPVLWVATAQDAFGEAPLEAGRAVLPHMQVVRILDSGHYPMIEQPDHTAGAVVHFLNTLIPEAMTTPMITGKWKITIQQHLNGNDVEVHGEADLVQHADRVEGKALIDFEPVRPYVKRQPRLVARPRRFVFSGTHRNGVVEHDYRTLDEPLEQFGHIMLQQTGPDALEGRFQGFGPENEEVVHGRVVYKRIG